MYVVSNTIQCVRSDVLLEALSYLIILLISAPLFLRLLLAFTVRRGGAIRALQGLRHFHQLTLCVTEVITL